MAFYCLTCERSVRSNSKAVEFDGCHQWCHIRCGVGILSQVCRKLTALALLLHELIQPVFDAIRPANSTRQIEELLNYVEDRCIVGPTWNPPGWSVFGVAILPTTTWRGGTHVSMEAGELDPIIIRPARVNSARFERRVN